MLEKTINVFNVPYKFFITQRRGVLKAYSPDFKMYTTSKDKYELLENMEILVKSQVRPDKYYAFVNRPSQACCIYR
jgi:hypothetical protein